MLMGRVDLSGYVDVAARIVEFRGKHPEGSLQPLDLSQPFTVQTVGGQTFIVVVAAAYRTPDDSRPGVGMAYEPFPGQTPYTRGSELQNAETSAWGRAIVAALAADTRAGVASADEIRNRRADNEGYEADEARRNVIANARNAINSADTVEALDQIAERIAQLEHNGLSTDDAAFLRGVLRDRRAAIEPPCSADTAPAVEPEPPKPEAVRDWALDKARTEAELRETLVRLRGGHPEVLDAVVENGTGDEERLGRLLQGRIHDFAGMADGPEMVTEQQHRTMHALWRELDYDGDNNRDQRLAVTAKIVQRELDSSAGLTSAEADVVIGALKRRKRQREQRRPGEELVGA